MLDAVTVMRWTLVPSLALAGARIALGSLRASPSSVRWARGVSVLATLLAGVGLAAGLRRVPEIPRAAALPPGPDSARAPAPPPPPAPSSAAAPRLALAIFGPVGGRAIGEQIGRRWDAVGHVKGAELAPAELCARFAHAPTLCLRAAAIEPAAATALRDAAAELGAAEVNDCASGVEVGVLVSDRVDDLEATIDDKGTRDLSLLGQTVTVGVKRRAGLVELSLRSDQATEHMTVRPEDGTPPKPWTSDAVRLKLATGSVRLRVAVTEVGGALRVRLFDLHLVCT